MTSIIGLLQRQRLLENWMQKLLSDIAVSRSATAAIFLELEAAARSCMFSIYNLTSSFEKQWRTVPLDVPSIFNVFLLLIFAAFHDASQYSSEEKTAGGTTPSNMIHDNSHGFGKAQSSSAVSVSGDDTLSEVSDPGTLRHGKDKCSDHIVDNLSSKHDLINPTERSEDHAASSKDFIYEDNSTDKVTNNSHNAIAVHLDGTKFAPATQDSNLNAHVKRLSMESIGSDLNSVGNTETTNSSVTTLLRDVSHHIPGNHEPSLAIFQLDERHKLGRILDTQNQRLAMAKTDVEDLIARLNQEMAARQYLVMKVSNV